MAHSVHCEHANDSTDEPTYLFSINDLPVLESFELNREEALDEGDGHQKVQHSA